MVVQYLGLVVDQQLLDFLNDTKKSQPAKLNEAMKILLIMDRLLATHPNRQLKEWIDFARGWGDNSEEKDYYEANAKRLLTTWGGDPVNDYSGRIWSGLIRDYYVPRWKNYHGDGSNDKKQNMRNREEQWITSPGVPDIKPYNNPLSKAIEIFNTYKNSLSEN